MVLTFKNWGAVESKYHNDSCERNVSDRGR